MTDESRALQSIFFGKQACEKNHYGKPERMPQNMAVLGAGLMGAGIATVSCFSFLYSHFQSLLFVIKFSWISISNKNEFTLISLI